MGVYSEEEDVVLLKLVPTVTDRHLYSVAHGPKGQLKIRDTQCSGLERHVVINSRTCLLLRTGFFLRSWSALADRDKYGVWHCLTAAYIVEAMHRQCRKLEQTTLLLVVGRQLSLLLL